MSLLREIQRPALLPLAFLALGVYYLVVYAPLGRRTQSLDDPLENAWRRLSVSLDQTNATTIDFLHLTNQLNETRHSLLLVENAKREAIARLQLSPVLQAKLAAPFQLVDFQNARSKEIDDLDRQAKKDGVAVDAAVFAGFPEHTADTVEPTLLWPALSLATDSLLKPALACRLAAIHSLEVPLTANAALPTRDSSGRWDQIPLQLEFTASAANAFRFIRSLPLRAEELKAAGVPEAQGDKNPLLIDRLIIKKQTPEKTDEVRVWVRVLGFVRRE